MVAAPLKKLGYLLVLVVFRFSDLRHAASVVCKFVATNVSNIEPNGCHNLSQFALNVIKMLSLRESADQICGTAA